TGRSSWSLANGLMAVVVNVTLDVLLIPRYGITGAAIGWAVAIIITNLTPLAQLAAFGPGAVASLSAVGAGCLVQAGGLWRFRDSLRLKALPGASRLTKLFPN